MIQEISLVRDYTRSMTKRVVCSREKAFYKAEEMASKMLVGDGAVSFILSDCGEEYGVVEVRKVNGIKITRFVDLSIGKVIRNDATKYLFNKLNGNYCAQ